MSEPLHLPWWKERMIWLVVGLPAVAVVASFVTLFIAADNPDPLVNAGYHKEGMAPGKDTSREDLAARLSIAGQLEMRNGEARIELSGHLDTLPASLDLLLLHPTQADLDLRLQLKSVGPGVYSAAAPENLAGKRRWILESRDQAWRLAGEFILPLNGATRLSSD